MLQTFADFGQLLMMIDLRNLIQYHIFIPKFYQKVLKYKRCDMIVLPIYI